MTSPPRAPRITIIRDRTPHLVWPGGLDPSSLGFFFAPQRKFQSAIRVRKMRRHHAQEEGQGQHHGGGSFGAGHKRTVRLSDSAVTFSQPLLLRSGLVP